MGAGGSIHKHPNRRASKVIKEIINNAVEDQCREISESGLKGHELEAKLNELIHTKENSLRHAIIERAKVAVGKSLRICEEEVESGKREPVELSAETMEQVDTFRDICVNSIESIRQKNQYRWIVGIDGSESSHVAYETALALRKKIDHISLFHAYNNDQKHQSDMLQQKYDVSLTTSAIKPELYSFIWKEQNGTVEKMLIELLQELVAIAESPYGEPTPDFFVCGTSHSVKSGFEKTSLGSVADLALRRVHLPIIITKGKIPPKGPKKYIMAVDDSEQSKRGLDILLTLLTPKDILRIVHVCGAADNTKFMDEQGENTIEKIKTYYEDEIDVIGPVDSKVIMLAVEGGVSQVNTLIEYVNNEQPDFLALAPRAQLQHTSFTEQVMYKVYSGIILCKS